MPNSKYRITEIIDENFHTRQARKQVREQIRKACNGITAATLSHYETAEEDSTYMIPADHLYKIKLILKVSNMEDLFNVKVLVNN